MAGAGGIKEGRMLGGTSARGGMCVGIGGGTNWGNTGRCAGPEGSAGPAFTESVPDCRGSASEITELVETVHRHLTCALEHGARSGARGPACGKSARMRLAAGA